MRPPSPSLRLFSGARTPLGWIPRYYILYRWYFLAGLLSLFVTNLLQALMPWILKLGVEDLRAAQEGLSVANLWVAPSAMVVIGVIACITRTLSRGLIYAGGRHVEYQLRTDLADQLLELPLAYYHSHHIGDLISRATHDTSDVRLLVGAGTMQLANTVFTFLVTLILIFYLNAELATLTLLPYLGLGYLFNKMSKLTYQYSLRVQEQMGHLSAQVQESLAGIIILKSFRLEERAGADFDDLSRELKDRNLKFALLRSLTWPTVGIVSGLSVAILFGAGGRSVMNGDMTLGDLVAFQAYLVLLLWPTLGLGWIINVIQRGLAAADRIHAILEAPIQLQKVTTDPAWDSQEAKEDSGDASSGLVINNLSFTYPKARSASLMGISLSIQPGERVALVGRTGAGKSTLARLLTRLYEPPRRTVFLGGQDVTRIPLDELRRSIALVPQESFLFSTTVLHNLIYARPTSARETGVEVAKRTQIHDEIEGFPHGYDTRVGERGITLSGGQRQRTALARSLLEQSELLILDDAFSSVDSHTEKAILDELEIRRPSAMVLLISHRVSTAMCLDRILVIDEGRLVEEGTHEELIQAGGLYSRLAHRQALESSLTGGKLKETTLGKDSR